MSSPNHCPICKRAGVFLAPSARGDIYRCPRGHQFRPVNLEPPPDERFDGEDYVDQRDRPRLGKQLQAVYDVMVDGKWHPIHEVTEATGYPQQSVARQMRYLRADRFGGHEVERRHKGGGLYEYRLKR